MSALVSYKLTQYNDIRQIQFQYSKLQDQNAQLKSKLQILQEIYRRSIVQHQQQRIKILKKQQNLIQENKENRNRFQEFVNFFNQAYIEFHNFHEINISQMSQNQYEVQNHSNKIGQQCQILKQKVNKILNQSLRAIHKSNDLSSKYERQVQNLRENLKLFKIEQKQLKEERLYLTQEINKLQNTNMILMNQLSLQKRQNTDYKLKLYEINKLQEQKNHNDLSRSNFIQDHNFALDLLQYQKETLHKIFTKTIAMMPVNSVKEVLQGLYSSYQQITQNYRQKLQIQYDLEDLERQYKRQKNSKINQKLLIQLRKQIQQFRTELQKQKDTMVIQEGKMETIFLQLQACERQQRKLRDYTVEIEKKFKEIRDHKDTKRVQPYMGHSDSRIRLKVTSNDEIIQQMVRKDRQNIDKIFRQTRNIKQTS